jgi:hypothetical protein
MVRIEIRNAGLIVFSRDINFQGPRFERRIHFLNPNATRDLESFGMKAKK